MKLKHPFKKSWFSFLIFLVLILMIFIMIIYLFFPFTQKPESERIPLIPVEREKQKI
ncbi:MAG: hypothetical protein ACOC4G_03105 [Bacillota bacterium]